MKSKIRINELARDLEVKPNIILDLLQELGVDEKKTHSSSIDEDVALAIKSKLGGSMTAGSHRGGNDEEGGGTAVAVEEFTEQDNESRPAARPHSPDQRENGAQPGASPVTAAPQAPAQEPASVAPVASDAETLTQARSRATPLRPPLSGLRPPLASATSRPIAPILPTEARQAVGTPPAAVLPRPVGPPAPPAAQVTPATPREAAPVTPGEVTPRVTPKEIAPVTPGEVTQPATPKEVTPQVTPQVDLRPSQPAAVSPDRVPAHPETPRAPLRPQSTPGVPAAPQSHAAPGVPQQPQPGPGAPHARPGPGRDVPLFRPGQVIAPGPRPPSPVGERPPQEARTSVPGAPRPAVPQPGAPRPPQPRPAGGQPGGPGGQAGSHGGPRPQGPGSLRPQLGGGQQTQEAGGQQLPQQPSGPNRPTLVGQPAPRPVVPPRQDLIDRIRQSRPAPGAPVAPPPRPGMPQVRPPTSAPGQPIYGGRPGGPPGAYARSGPSGPARPVSPVTRPGGLGGGPSGPRRPMHPTTPLRPESAQPVPSDTQRRLQQKGRPTLSVEQRKREAEGKLRGPDPRTKAQPLPNVNKEITIGEGITVKELSEKLGVKSSLVIKLLFDRKIYATINQTLDLKLAGELARDFGATTSTLSFEEEATWEVELAENPEHVQVRAPVVTVMGHVDHGKTSLLDAIRSTTVASREAGGITQHIGASVVETHGKRIIFIDTPGHEAFTRMRARGAKVTDLVILVVSADDGVMPQTIEAIDHARAAKVPIIVAINKIDKPGAEPERIKQQLADRGLLADDWGGDIIMVRVSAKTLEGVDTLLEMVLLAAEMQNLKANPSRPGIGSVLEAELDKGRGPVATVLVQNGTLRVGDFFICGQVFGKVRAMYDNIGLQVREAGPSTPVEVIGLEALPDVGDALQVVSDTSKAKQIVMYREIKSREQSISKGSRITLEQFKEQAKEGDVKDLNLILKTDVGGTAEVLSEMLQKLSTDKVRIRIISKNVGAINESDVLLATASSAIIIGFNVKPERNAASLADKEKIEIRQHSIIYELTDEIKKAMTGMLDPVYKEVFRGKAEVREVFSISKVGSVAGCYVTDGSLTRDTQVRVMRENAVVHTGKIESLRRFKNDVSEVKQGFECGVVLQGYSDLKQGDLLEGFGLERVAAVLGA